MKRRWVHATWYFSKVFELMSGLLWEGLQFLQVHAAILVTKAWEIAGWVLSQLTSGFER
jgi:hypothetical protein